ncbi:MAG: gamma-glutamyl-gamma-aminobutyrate hydrolase family protein [Myxococcota bacterium]
MKQRVLLLKPARTSSREALGDYEAWFQARVGHLADFHPVELHAGEAPPSANRFDAIIMSGSPRSVMDADDSMARAGDFMVEAADAGIPVLGVCFGHQLLAWRLGGVVLRNPRGRELGTISVTLTEAGRGDPLFHGLPPVISVQSTHEDHVEPLPGSAVLLATTAHTPVQAFAHGPRLRAVQFHPEMDRASTRWVVRDEKLALSEAERRRIHDAVHDTPWGARLLENFLSRF